MDDFSTEKVFRPLKASDAVHNRRWNWWWWHSKSDCWDPKKDPEFHFFGETKLAEFQLIEEGSESTLKELLDAVCKCIDSYPPLPFPVVVWLPQTWNIYVVHVEGTAKTAAAAKARRDIRQLWEGRQLPLNQQNLSLNLGSTRIGCANPECPLLKQVEKPAPKTLKQKAGHNWKGAWFHYVLHSETVVPACLTHIVASPDTAGTAVPLISSNAHSFSKFFGRKQSMLLPELVSSAIPPMVAPWCIEYNTCCSSVG